MSSASYVARVAASDDVIVQSSPQDERAKPLVEDLIREYDKRYRDIYETPNAAEIEVVHRYPAEAFAPPHGAFLLLLREGETIGGGAFMRKDVQTAELKRIWTDARFRRQGLAKRIVEALEAQALNLGYRRIYLTTGFRQPEAVGLYRGLGYTPLYDPDGDLKAIFSLPFEKLLGAGVAQGDEA